MYFMKRFLSISWACWMIVSPLHAQTDTTIYISGTSSTIIVDSKRPELNISSPNGGEEYDSGTGIYVDWDAIDDSFDESPISIYLSPILGGYFDEVANGIENNSSYNIDLPYVNSAFARFKITAIDYYGNSNIDYSDGYFTIGDPDIWDGSGGGEEQEATLYIYGESNTFTTDSKTPELTWLSPNGGEEYESGETIEAQWSSIDDSFDETPISIYLSSDLGQYFFSMAENIVNTENILLNLPSVNSAFARFQVTAIDHFGNTNTDYSDMYFTVGDPYFVDGNYGSNDTTIFFQDESSNFIGDSQLPTIEWIYPNGGEQFDNYETITTLWNAEDESFGDEAISIYLAKELGGYYESYNSEDLPNLLSYDIQLPHADEAFARFKVTAIDSFGNSSEDFGDNYFILGDPFGNYNVHPYDDLVILDWGWSGYQLILVEQEALSFMDEGDQIHAVDFNGIISDECSEDIYGIVSVAQDTYSDNATNPYSLYTLEGYEDCDETETAQAGYVAGNEAGFLHYDSSSDSFYELSPSFVSWSGIFGDTPQDTLSFKFYDQSEDKTYLINEAVPFTPDMIEGDAMFPYEFTYDTNTYEDGLFLCDFNPSDYEYNGSITSTLLNVESGDQIASFVGDECRGTTDAIESPFNTTVFLLMNFGNPALSIIDSFEQITMRNQFSLNNISENRNLYSFNIYRENELIDEGVSDYYYFDDDQLLNGEYCYEIALSDSEGNEMVISDDQCIEITSENEIILGDTNNDTLVNVVDVVMMVSIILDSGEYIVSGDVNQDGLLNVVDVVMVVSWILNP